MRLNNQLDSSAGDGKIETRAGDRWLQVRVMVLIGKIFSITDLDVIMEVLLMVLYFVWSKFEVKLHPQQKIS